MSNKTLKVTVVGVALLPVIVVAAIDDQGMQYVTAAEGLHGSLRVDILHNTNNDGNKHAGLKGGAENSLRLWVNGSADLSGGLTTTYFWEVRSNQAGTNKDAMRTYFWDLGFSGVFGDIEFGKLSMVAPRLVPSASLAFVRGSERGGFAADPGDNGLRWESRSINGLKAGISAIIADKNAIDAGSDDDTVDEWSIAAKYDSPLGFSVGVGYEVQALPYNSPTASITLQTVATTASGGSINTVAPANTDGKTGWRFGARYSQDNWLVGYEYRRYEAYEGFSSVGSTVNGEVFDAAGGVNGSTSVLRVAFLHNDDVVYSVHALGVQVKIDRITATANYSVEQQQFGYASSKVLDIKQDTLALDAAYALGSRSTMVLGWKSVDTESLPVDSGNVDGFAVNKNAVKETYLFYRVDF